MWCSFVVGVVISKNNRFTKSSLLLWKWVFDPMVKDVILTFCIEDVMVNCVSLHKKMSFWLGRPATIFRLRSHVPPHFSIPTPKLIYSYQKWQTSSFFFCSFSFRHFISVFFLFPCHIRWIKETKTTKNRSLQLHALQWIFFFKKKKKKLERSTDAEQQSYITRKGRGLATMKSLAEYQKSKMWWFLFYVYNISIKLWLMENPPSKS